MALELASDEKSEYYQGQIYAVSGVSIIHNIISGSTFASLSYKLKGKNCRPFGSDQ